MMTPSMEGPGPGREMLLADDHPDAVYVAEQADRPELFFFMNCAWLWDKGDDVLTKGVGPPPCGFPAVEKGGKAIRPGDREGGKLMRPPSIRADGLALFHGPEGRANIIPRNGLEGCVECGVPWGPALPEGGPFGGGLRKPGM